jgi:DNA-binding transcriptional ArsR family regulator
MSRGRSGAAAAMASAGEAAPVFAALGDPTRLRLVVRLCKDGPLSIVRLCESADVTRQAVTKHLEALAQAGLLRDTRVGRERLWELEPKRLAQARDCLDQIAAQWDDAIDRLRAHLEG